MKETRKEYEDRRLKLAIKKTKREVNNICGVWK